MTLVTMMTEVMMLNDDDKDCDLFLRMNNDGGYNDDTRSLWR